jgi:hypothetical protein
MLEVVTAGVIALASRWLLDGGIRRRELHLIGEELELAKRVDAHYAEALRASAHRRLERYVRPPFAARVAPETVRLIASTSTLVAGLALVWISISALRGRPESMFLAALIGIAVGLVDTLFGRATKDRATRG